MSPMNMALIKSLFVELDLAFAVQPLFMKSWNVVSLHFYSSANTLVGTDYARVAASRPFVYLNKVSLLSALKI